jgi:excisionase family DNA binding protein
VNLADAIRRATNVALPNPDREFFGEGLRVVSGNASVPSKTELVAKAEGEESTMNEAFDNTEPTRDLASSATPNSQQSVVRLELLLTPDQLSNLFRAVAANQHSLWTLRDAAAYLRISPKALTQLAEEGQVPGFLVDGRWRFAKNAVDEWLQSTAVIKEAA